MECPRDQSTLARFEVDGLTLDTCPTCEGLWFDGDEFRRAKDLADPNLDWMDFEIWKHEERFSMEPHGRKCPSCLKPLVSLRYGDTEVLIDACSACHGIWLDGHEFERLIRALEHEASSKPASEYVLQTLKEALDIIKSPRHLAEEWSDFKHVFNLLKVRLLVERPTLLEAVVQAQKSSPF